MRSKTDPTLPPMSGVRWTVAALLFFATTVNYLDRQIYALLVPKFEGDLRLGPLDLAFINVCFLLPYGFGMVFVGRFLDRVGVKKGLGVTFMLWNLASMAHALVGNLGSFAFVRALLGVGEAGNFPGCTKAVSEWFPKKERATAFGIFNSGSNIGFVLASVATPFLTEALHWGWQACFAVLGGIGVVWIFFWSRLYHRPAEHSKVSAAELAHIESDDDPPAETFTYAQVLGMRPLWGVAVTKALTEAPWWLYITWLPKFLTDQYHLPPAFMALAIPPVFLLADVGAVGGGWLSSTLIKRGWSVGRARKTAMTVCGVCALPIMFVGLMPASMVGVAVALIALGASAHQGWSSNVYTLLSDTLPKGAVGMAVGVITAVGVTGAAAFQFFIGASVQAGSYAPPFILAGTLYLVGVLVFHLIVPKVEPVRPGKPVNMVWIGVLAACLLGGLLTIQYVTSKPPYADMAAYEAHRAAEIKVDGGVATLGPKAKVGWMDARWVGWSVPGQSTPAKVELVKFDAHGHPFVEGNGDKADKYVGPSLDVVRQELGPRPPDKN